MFYTIHKKNKWEAELNIEISDDEWYKMCMTQSTTTCSQTEREGLGGRILPDSL